MCFVIIRITCSGDEGRLGRGRRGRDFLGLVAGIFEVVVNILVVRKSFGLVIGEV